MDFDEVTRVSFNVDGFGMSRLAVGERLPAERLPAERLLAERLLADLLSATDHLIVLRCGEPPYRAVLGVPHHAAPGAERICERRLDVQGRPNPREADENAALYAFAAFAALAGQGEPSKLVIMAHPTTHDPNKVLNSPYCREIFAEPVDLIFECHGSKRERRLDLELSAGRNPLPNTLSFGEMLAEALSYRYSLGVQREAGIRQALIYTGGGEVFEGELELPAHKTHSLAEAGRRRIQALHLEARPRFRRFSGEGRVSDEGQALGEAIALSMIRYLLSPAIQRL